MRINRTLKTLEASDRYSENILTPVTLSGVIVPCNKLLAGAQDSDFKLACASGIEYFIDADAHWRQILSIYSWEEVKVKGLLNVSNRTVVLQRVFPKGPSGERESAIDLAARKSQNVLDKLTKNVSDLVFTPAFAAGVNF